MGHQRPFTTLKKKFKRSRRQKEESGKPKPTLDHHPPTVIESHLERIDMRLKQLNMIKQLFVVLADNRTMHHDSQS